jgi:hypothetical protein
VAFGWPILLHRPSKGAPVTAQIDFLTKGAYVVGICVVSFILSGVGAILIVRQARLEYQERRTEMLKELIEGTQEDIRKEQNVDA